MKILDQTSRTIKARELPGRKQEAWKYLSLKELSGAQFISVKSSELSAGDRREIRERSHRDCHHVVIWNGEFQQEFLNSRDVEPVSMTDLDASWKGFEEKWIGDEQRVNLTTEFYDDYVQGLRRSGVALRIAAGTQVMKPIQIVVGGVSGTERVSSTDIWIDAETESQFEILLDRRSQSAKNLFLGRLRLRLQPRSKVELIQAQNLSLEDFDFFRTTVFLEESARLNCLTVQKGGKLTRHNADVVFLAENASADLNGLYLVTGEQVCDHHTLIDHTKGACVSRQLYKGILDDNARAVFDGRVRIRKEAQKASSEQLNKNLLLTSAAEADSKPQLEIEADDVKATHGSAIGQMAESEIFYLESRGIDPARAREMLARGFVDELVDSIQTLAFKELISDLLSGKASSESAPKGPPQKTIQKPKKVRK